MALTLDEVLLAIQYNPAEITDLARRGYFQRKLDAAVELTGRYAPNAPESLKDEATIRLIAWLLAGRFENQADVSGLRSSGAAGLLESYRSKFLRIL